VGVSPVHPFWHTIYLGLGFVQNKEVPRPADETSIAKARSIDREVRLFSPEYERIMQRATLRLVVTHPDIAIANFGAKLGIIALLFLFAANLGVKALFSAPLEPRIQWTVTLCLALTALPGILAVPHPRYLLGFA